MLDLKHSFAFPSSKSPTSTTDACSDQVDSSTVGTDDSNSLDGDSGDCQSNGKKRRKRKDLKVLDSKTAQRLGELFYIFIFKGLQKIALNDS